MNKNPYWYYDMMSEEENEEYDEYDDVSYEEARGRSM